MTQLIVPGGSEPKLIKSEKMLLDARTSANLGVLIHTGVNPEGNPMYLIAMGRVGQAGFWVMQTNSNFTVDITKLPKPGALAKPDDPVALDQGLIASLATIEAMTMADFRARFTSINLVSFGGGSAWQLAALLKVCFPGTRWETPLGTEVSTVFAARLG